MATYIYIVLIVIFAGLAIYAFASRKKYNTEIEQKNKELKKTQKELSSENNDLRIKNTNLSISNAQLSLQNSDLQKSIEILSEEKNNIDYTLYSLKGEAKTWEIKAAEAKASLAASQSAAKANAAAQEELTKKAFESYCETLESAYKEIEEAHDSAKAALVDSIQQEQKKLKEISATRAAAHEALLKEQEIKENKDNYRLIPSQRELHDIKLLRSVEKELIDGRPVRMIIWNSYFLKKANDLCSRVLGPNDVCGIYKITSLSTDKCYIGQAKNIKNRWREHMKCGLGIDTPTGNKLYAAMQEEGLDNFTFELLIKCPPEELNAKEAYFIQLYMAYDYGFNSNKGIKT